ncbi:MAG TPA: hypothetical protein VFO83_15205, partial [Aggregicoccus sp.]|nr:hypothetical protein [Aggregicoccus sp.]
VVYAARPLGDALSVAPLLGALLWGQRARDGGGLRAGVWCGVLLGAAFVVRYPSAMFGFPLALSLLAARRARALAGFAAGCGAVLLALGLLDLWTWGGPWHSARAFVHFNLFAGGAASRFGTKAWWWYAPILAGMAPLLLTLHVGRGLARRDLLVGALGTYLGALTLMGHKESRFLLPLLPLWVAVAAGPAWRTLSTRLTARRTRVALALLQALSSVAAATVLLPIGLERPGIEAFMAAGREPGLTGLLVTGMPWVRSGGYFYLHRDVPLRFADEGEGDWRSLMQQQRQLSHVVVKGTTPDAGALRGEGLCPRGRWGPVSLWRRCAPPG